MFNNSVISFNVSVTQTSIVYWAINDGTGATPTDEDLLNCGNTSDGTSFFSCGRVLLAAGETVQVNATNITTSAADYTLYTTITNEFIPRPIALLTPTSNVVDLIDNSISVTPSDITIAQGSCQSANLTLGTAPTSDVSVTVSSTDPTHVYIQSSNGTNTTVFNFTNNGTNYANITICATTDATSGAVLINLNVTSGTNAGDYNNGTITVTVAAPVGDLEFSTLNVTVPLGGCSSTPIMITPNTTSTNNITLDTTALTAAGYYLLSNPTFNNTSGAQNITICSLANATQNATIPVVLDGTNASLYTINNASSANITVTTNTTSTPNISTITTTTVGNTTTITLTSNLQGSIYYVLAVGNNATNLNFVQIQTAVNTGNTTIQSQADFLTHLYVTDRYEVVGMANVTAGVPITIN